MRLLRFDRGGTTLFAEQRDGDGPPLVFGAKWVSHLEEEWDDLRARSFYENLAQNHLVVRYDRLGAGLSDGDIPLPPTVANETRVLETVIDATGADRHAPGRCRDPDRAPGHGGSGRLAAPL